jgi:hypothetical protein
MESQEWRHSDRGRTCSTHGDWSMDASYVHASISLPLYTSWVVLICYRVSSSNLARYEPSDLPSARAIWHSAYFFSAVRYGNAKSRLASCAMHPTIQISFISSGRKRKGRNVRIRSWIVGVAYVHWTLPILIICEACRVSIWKYTGHPVLCA